MTKYNTRMQSYTFNQLLSWNRSFGLHSFDVLAGHEFYAYSHEYLKAGKTNLVDGIHLTSSMNASLEIRQLPPIDQNVPQR